VLKNNAKQVCREKRMFIHDKRLQFEARPSAPDALYARKLQELLGGAWGEVTVAMQYLMQGWNCRGPAKYRDMLLDIGTEELAHIEMLSTMIARLLEGAPLAQDDAAQNPLLMAAMGGMDVQQAIVSGLGPTLSDSNGYPWNGRYIVSSGNLLADFRANLAAESQGRVQAVRLYEMTDDPGVREMLSFLIARDSMHQNQWIAAIADLEAEGVDTTPVPASFPRDLQYEPVAYQFINCSGGEESSQGRWASGAAPDGGGEFQYVANPEAMGSIPEPPAIDPRLHTMNPNAAGAPVLSGAMNGSMSDGSM
jgi:Mn-containing catalase